MSDEGGEPACALALFDGSADIADRDDLERMVRAFYGAARVDDVLGPVFAAAEVDWDVHIPRLVDFWAWQLLGDERYRRNPLRAHERVHALVPFTDEHYGRWVALHERTIDQRFSGPRAELAKQRGRRMASAMARLLGGDASPGASPIEVGRRVGGPHVRPPR